MGFGHLPPSCSINQYEGEEYQEGSLTHFKSKPKSSSSWKKGNFLLPWLGILMRDGSTEAYLTPIYSCTSED